MLGATVEKDQSTGQWVAWCGQHSGGVRGTRADARRWAVDHNAERHKPLVDGR